jgi:ABC-type glycerol-3-phosphate transport system substrate-binding protein
MKRGIIMSISKRVLLVTSFISIMIFFSACNSSGGSKQSPLDPDKPVTVTIWHYYSGHNKENFDTIVEKFNETIGMEKGIVVEALSQGDVQQLADAVYNSANKGLGADPMPDIFAAYGDNAFRVNQVTPLITLDTYFSPEELSSYRKEFLEEGNFLEDGKYRILPIAKSTENLYVNKTFWDKFAEETGASIENLATWEGLAFAIPINHAKEIYGEILEKGYVSRPFLGIIGSEVINENNNDEYMAGVLVRGIVEESAAGEAGIIEGDIIINFNENDILDMESLMNAIEETKVGDEVKVIVIREESQRIEFVVTMKERK